MLTPSLFATFAATDDASATTAVGAGVLLAIAVFERVWKLVREKEPASKEDVARVEAVARGEVARVEKDLARVEIDLKDHKADTRASLHKLRDVVQANVNDISLLTAQLKQFAEQQQQIARELSANTRLTEKVATIVEREFDRGANT